MRKRDKGFIVRLSNEEMIELNRKVKTKGIPREVYVRSILNGYEPVGKPSVEYLDMIRELRRIGNNLNQIAMIANKTKNVGAIEYTKAVRELNQKILMIEKITKTPISIE